MILYKKIVLQFLSKCLPVLVVFFTAALFFSVGPLCAASVKTGFLPLNTDSVKAAQKSLAQADKDLVAVLAATDIFFIPRAEAETLADYQGIWPPSMGTMQNIAAKTGFSRLVVGRLINVGDRVTVGVQLVDTLFPTKSRYFAQTLNASKDLKTALGIIVSAIKGDIRGKDRIISIVPEGNKRIDTGPILRKIKTKVGDIYTQDAIKEALKEIHKMGYFSDVQVDVSNTPKGKRIVFKLVENPVINSINFKGVDELKIKDIKEVVDIKKFSIFNPVKVGTAEKAISQLYKNKGYYNSKVSSTISDPNDRAVAVQFTIEEGEKIYIKEIHFEGNETFDDDELLDAIETDEKGFMSWLTAAGLLDTSQVRQDTNRIVAFYNNEGFLKAKVSPPEITQKEGWFYVKFFVEEGMRLRVGTVDISGDILDEKDDLLDLITLGDKKYLSKKTIRKDIAILGNYFSEAGYAFAKIRPIITGDPGVEGRTNVVFEVDKGNLVYIERITIKGNTRTRDNVIRRELLIAEGGLFDSKALRESNMALQRLTYFSKVNITPEPSFNPDRINIIIELEEKRTGSFSVGAGYSSADKFVVTGNLAENNVFGRGDTISIGANISSKSTRFNLGYTNPRLNDSALSWGIDLFSTQRELDDYTRDAKGGGIRVGYPIFGKWRLYGNYTYTDTKLSEVGEKASYIIKNSAGLPLTSATKVSLVRDTRNRRYNAFGGSNNSISVKYAGGILGGDTQFTKVQGTSSWYFSMPFKTVFHIKGSVGHVFENEPDKLPVYERFFLGGLSSIRGFNYAQISPIDVQLGQRIGGDKMWYTNTEIIFPLIGSQEIMGVIFYDAGQVLNDNENWGDSDVLVKQGAGFGIRWFSPLGPLQIVWGYNLDPQLDEDDTVWDFSIGGSF